VDGGAGRLVARCAISGVPKQHVFEQATITPCAPRPFVLHMFFFHVLTVSERPQWSLPHGK
jgi:hypothetical protein